MHKIVQALTSVAISMVIVSPAFAWCGASQYIVAQHKLVAATPTDAEHHEWITSVDKRYGSGVPLQVRKGFKILLYRDGRYSFDGTMGNFIRHRDLYAYVGFRARFANGPSPVNTWRNRDFNDFWGMGKGHSRTSPDYKSRNASGQIVDFTSNQFDMVSDPLYVIGPVVRCEAGK